MGDNGEGANDSMIDPGPRRRIVRPGQLGLGHRKTRALQEMGAKFAAQYKTVANTMEMLRRPVCEFLLECGLVKPEDKLPLGDGLLELLRRSRGGNVNPDQRPGGPAQD